MNTHTYKYNNSTYNNMKELCEAIPNFKSKDLKNLLRWGIVTKEEI